MRLNHYTNDSESAIDTYFPTTLNKTTLQAPNKTSRCFYQLLTKDKKTSPRFKKHGDVLALQLSERTHAFFSFTSECASTTFTT